MEENAVVQVAPTVPTDPVAEYRARMAAEAARVGRINALCAAAGNPQAAGADGKKTTLAALAIAVRRGAHIIRVHNVAYAKQFFTVLGAISQVRRGSLS